MTSVRINAAIRIALVAAALCAVTPARAQFPITESFMNTTAPGWSILPGAVLTAANAIDANGAGWLRLTNATTNQAGSAIYNTNFLSTSGITITFDYADYGGTGADGFSFYLIDGATAAPTVGSSGGSLGYAAKYSNVVPCNGAETVVNPGVTNGYVGIGFDEFGNFSNCESGTASPGAIAQSVVIRGSGTTAAVNSQQTAFRYLTGRTVASVQAGARIDNVPRATPRKARIAIVNQRITVSLDFGAGFLTVINAYDLSTATGQAALPATFKMGFSGSTGGSTNFHEIRNVRVDLPANLAITQAVAPTTVSVNDTVTFTITISNDPTNAAGGTIINDAFPASLSNVSWTTTTTNGGFGAPVLPRTSGTGNLAETIATFPKGSSITYTVTATVTAAAAGQVLANTVNLIPPTGLSNLLSNTVAANLTVNKMGSTTTFTSGTNPTLFGQPTTLTATVTGVAAGPPPPAPTGTVNFLDGVTVVGSCTLAAGTCSTPVSSLAVGSHTLTASYLGVTDFSASTSSSTSQVVNRAATTTALASSVNPTRFGQSTTLTATVAAVAPGVGVPAGTVTFLDGVTSIGSCTLTAGACTLPVSSLSVATHSLTAVYAGSANFLASTSTALSQVVNQALTSTTLASSVNPTRFGQSTTLTATVAVTAPGAGPASGTVTFLDGVTSIGSCTLTAGACTLAVTILAVGTHTLSAGYGGDASFTASTSANLTQVVNLGATTTTLASSVNPTRFGQSTTLTATVAVTAPGAGTPSGTVTFLDGVTSIGSCTLTVGACTLAVSNLSVATHPLTAVYAGSASFLASTSTAVSQVVNQAGSVTALAASPSPSVFGETVTLTATVGATAPGAGTPAGTVTFFDGPILLGTAPLDGAGVASLPVSSFAVGAHSLAASYGGDARFLASGSSATALTVLAASTTTSVASSLLTSTFGDPVTFTASVTVVGPGAGTPGGQVRFFSDGVLLGDATLDGTGQASLLVGGAVLSVGAHAITAQYLGDASFSVSTSPVLTQAVSFAPATVAVLPDVSPSVTGQPVRLLVTVTVGGGLPAATGTITLEEGPTTLGSCTLSGGACTITLATLPVGTRVLVAAWGGDANYGAASSAPLSQQVDPAATSTALAAAPAASVFGEPVALNAAITVTAPGAGIPSGNVTFAEGNVVLGSVPVTASGLASLSISTLTVGSHDVIATYGGDPGFALSISPIASATVSMASATVAATAAPSPSAFGELVTFTVTVAPVAPSTATPTGSVTLREGATVLGSCLLASGTCTISTAALAAGDHALAIDFSGDGTFSAATPGSVAQHVDPGATSTDVAVTPNPATYGDAITFTANVAVLFPAAGSPSGSVAFSVDGVNIGTGTVTAGVASFTAAPAAIGGGTYDVIATYLGDTSFTGSASAISTLVVTPAPVTLLLASSPTAAVFGQPVTLTADASSLAGVPTGAVTFSVDGVTAGTVALSPAGQAILPVGALPVGGHALSAAFAGSANWLPASATTPLLVSQAATTLVLGAAPASLVFGQDVILTATVAVTAPGAGTPSGLVTFSDGAASLGSCTLASGSCSINAPGLAVGAHALSAAWAGDADLQGATGATSVTVARAATSTTVTAAPVSASFGDAVRFTANVTAVAPGAGLPTGTVTFSEGGVTLGIGTLDGSGQATLDLATLGVGAHDVTASYAGDGSFAASAAASPVRVTITRAPVTVNLTASPSSSTAGDLVTFTVTVTSPAGQPGGTVTVRDGTTVLGTCTLVGGTCTVTSASLLPGSHTLTATSGGDADFAGGTGSTTLVVGQSTTLATVTTSRNPSRHGRPVTFTATLTSPNGTPSGTVDFADEFGGTRTVIGTATLAGGVAQLTTRALLKGLHRITVEYAGAGLIAPTVGALPDDETVENSPPVAGSGTALSLGPSAASGASVTVSGAFDGGDLTVEAWVRPSWTSPAQVPSEPNVLRLGAGGSTQLSLGVAPDRTAVIAAVGSTRVSATAALDDGGWHHLALVAQGASITLRIDGVSAASFSASRAGAGNLLSIGEGFLGEVDEVRTWTTARTADQLAATSRGPLTGAEPGLAGLWRMDEGTGLELFDGGPLHLDGTAALAAGASSGFIASTAWRSWRVNSGEPLDPVGAGYDLDGDPLTLTIAVPATHGTATADGNALTVGYQSVADHLGTDDFTYRLDDGAARSDFQLAIQVTSVLACTASADCTGADLCVQGICRPAGSVTLRAGGCGCSTSGSEVVVPWALLLLLAGAWRRRRGRSGARGAP